MVFITTTIGSVFCSNYTRLALCYRPIYPMPIGCYNLFVSLYLVRNSTIYLYVFTNEGVGDILQNYAIQAFNHLDEIPHLDVYRYIIFVEVYLYLHNQLENKTSLESVRFLFLASRWIDPTIFSFFFWIYLQGMFVLSFQFVCIWKFTSFPLLPSSTVSKTFL